MRTIAICAIIGSIALVFLGCDPQPSSKAGNSTSHNDDLPTVAAEKPSASKEDSRVVQYSHISAEQTSATTTSSGVRHPGLANAPFDARQAKQFQQACAGYLGIPSVFSNSIGMKLVLIPPGKFQMGSPSTEAGADSDEQQHLVKVTKPFCIGAHEVTQAEFQRVMGRNPSNFCAEATGKVSVRGIDTNRFPVERVSWKTAGEFCEKLSSMSDERSSGRTYRLPTEAEWEFACRAGTDTPFHFGAQLNGNEANCRGDRPYGTSETGPRVNRTARVGSYTPNAFGLYDMHGNVWEWCSDWYDGQYYLAAPMDNPTGPSKREYRVARGGSWLNEGAICRSAMRNYVDWFKRDNGVGFRVVAILPDSDKMVGP